MLARAGLLCTDSREQARLESGDLIGHADWETVGELHEIVAGRRPGRTDDGEIVVFKSNGLAAWDLAAAARVVELV